MENKMKSIAKLCFLSTLLLLTACVTGTRNVNLEIPAHSSSKTGAGAVQIVSITDSRVFEQKPKSPDTPSAKADIATLSAETKATMIGRQRNGYGGAMGDVALPAGSTVQSEVKKLIATGLQNRGYVVSENSENKLSIDIEKFWAWMVPGFISVGFESEVTTALTLSNGTDTKTVKVAGVGNNEGQVASDANWRLTYSRAFENFLSNMDSALEDLGL